MATDKTDTAPVFAEPSAGTPPASFVQAILDEHAWRVAFDAGMQTYQGVAAWGPGDPVASSHPGFAALMEAGVLRPIVREGQEPPAGYDQSGNPVTGA
jgi:hypothetical protein